MEAYGERTMSNEYSYESQPNAECLRFYVFRMAGMDVRDILELEEQQPTAITKDDLFTDSKKVVVILLLL